ncbi:hypothetical protein O0I10_005327 [Lichtheimia ornata]|uniref:Casein kinase II subunit beta n=1 Tax=Lichtheimia ornata TaxID=688661 RepID=A0AAD7V521_9FUNG|nr:uncharacterized protein O0I10_005327 [Lichtheimia ornata]KAJ8658945.1 hypothetical protein O0I10_005327 [Lichtheimia ornata]
MNPLLMADIPDADMEDGYSSSSSHSQSWISWFCSLPGHEFYCRVPESFIEDSFNLVGLSEHVMYYREAYEMILDVEREDDEMSSKIPDVSLLVPSAEMLYGLIHQRYIITTMGLRQMLEKYKSGVFGYCPRFYCDRFGLLPCGQYDLPRRDNNLRLYCPNCNDIYVSSAKYSNVDGSHFGTSFPHLFVQAFQEVVAPRPQNIYVARIFGFRVNERSPTGPQMQWLRMTKP